MTDQADVSTVSRWLGWVRIAAVLIPVVGAVPTAVNVYYGWKHDIPWWQVPERAKQAELWQKNAECKFKYQPISTGNGTVVHIGSCPSTGDIALKVSAEDRDPVYSWIARSSLPRPGQGMSFLDHLIPPLRAADKATGKHRPMRLAQQAITVVCQEKDGANIVRIVKEGSQCFREVFSPFNGRVIKRDPVACDTQCKVGSTG